VIPLAFSSGALSIALYSSNCACPFKLNHFVIAAVVVVFP